MFEVSLNTTTLTKTEADKLKQILSNIVDELVDTPLWESVASWGVSITPLAEIS